VQEELDKIVQAVRSVFGVVDVDSRLEPDTNSSEDVSALQSRPPRKRARKVKQS
jgi:hypothetical protein